MRISVSKGCFVEPLLRRLQHRLFDRDGAHHVLRRVQTESEQTVGGLLLGTQEQHITCLDRVGAALRRLAGGIEVRALRRQHGPAGHAFGRLSPPSRRVGQALTLTAQRNHPTTAGVNGAQINGSPPPIMNSFVLGELGRYARPSRSCLYPTAPGERAATSALPRALARVPPSRSAPPPRSRGPRPIGSGHGIALISPTVNTAWPRRRRVAAPCRRE